MNWSYHGTKFRVVIKANSIGLFTRPKQMANRMTDSLQRRQYRYINIETSISSREIYDTTAVCLEETHQTLRRSPSPSDEIRRRQSDFQGRRYGSLSSTECAPHRNVWHNGKRTYIGLRGREQKLQVRRTKLQYRFQRA